MKPAVRLARAARLLLGLTALAAPPARGQPAPATADGSFPVTITVDASQARGDLEPIWRFFGADEPNYATMKDGTKLLRHLGELRPRDVYFRTHNLLNTGDGTPALKWGSTNAYREDAQGRPVYDWTVLDRIFDAYLARGVRPYVQIGFMPQALSTHPEPYRHEWRPGFSYDLISAGWAFPPRDYSRWAELSFQWVRHCVARYGREEVESWYFEVWNEPNLPAYWRASPEEFQKLHDYAIDAVRRALPTARVGGPDVAGNGGAFMDGFLAHVVSGRNYATGRTGTPTDFVSFHAKGAPVFVDGHVRMGMATQLAEVDRGFARIAAVPQLKAKPIVIGESDPEGCAACQGPHNGYRNGTMYSSYTAASFARLHALAQKHGVHLDGALTWAFEFEDQPYFAGFRALATNGIDLPVLNVFRMFSRMRGQRVAASSSAEIPLETLLKDGVRQAPDVAAIASLDPAAKRLAVLVWHYHDDDLPGPAAAVDLALAGLPTGVTEARLSHYRIDEDHSNSYAEWRRLGSPIAPSEEVYARIEKASELTMIADPAPQGVTAGATRLTFSLPRQAVSLLMLEWGEPWTPSMELP